MASDGDGGGGGGGGGGLVCVTGGSGFIGSSLVRRLLGRGYTVHATVKDIQDEGETKHLLAYGDPSRVFLAADSAGANIVHNVAMRTAAAADLRRAAVPPLLLGRVGHHGAGAGGAHPPRVAVHDRAAERPGGQVDDPRLSPPLRALLPAARVLVAVAGEDFLATKGRAYHAVLVASGWRGEAELVETPGEGHVFHLRQPGMAAAKKLMDRVVKFTARA